MNLQMIVFAREKRIYSENTPAVQTAAAAGVAGEAGVYGESRIHG